jgi:hypothetical protein
MMAVEEQEGKMEMNDRRATTQRHRENMRCGSDSAF